MKFRVGDRVKMTDAPFVVEIKELSFCEYEACCDSAPVFQFDDPFTGEEDWAHLRDFIHA